MAIDQKTLTGLKTQLEEELRSSRNDIVQIETDIIALTRDGAQEGGVPANHMADNSSDLYERERLLTIQVQLEERIALIEAAMERVEDGTFGICERCGQEIAGARLAALPFVRYCIECQEIVNQEQHVEVVNSATGR